MFFATRRFALAACAATTLALAGMSSAHAQTKEVRVGFFPGPYADQFKRVIQPQLEKKGWKVTATEFSNILQLNSALMDGSLEVNIFQNKGFMDFFNGQSKGDLVEVLRIPSAPMGLYSAKLKSVDEIKDGMSISIPNDSTSLGRSLMFLEKIGLVKVDPAVAAGKATEKNVIANPKNLKLVPIDAPQMPRSMADVDLSTPMGNHVIASGHLLSEALVMEDPAPQYQIIVTTRAGNADKEYTKDIVAAYKSDEFKTFIKNDPKAKGFSIPDYWR